MTTVPTAQPVTRYKRRIPVKTMQWTGTNEDQLAEWTNGNFRTLTEPIGGYTAKVQDVLHDAWIELRTGDHVAKGVKGEFYPITDEVLAETYETGPQPSLYKLTLRDAQGSHYFEHVLAYHYEFDDDSKTYAFDNATSDTIYEVAREVVVDIRDVTDIKAAVAEFVRLLGVVLDDDFGRYLTLGEAVDWAQAHVAQHAEREAADDGGLAPFHRFAAALLGLDADDYQADQILDRLVAQGIRESDARAAWSLARLEG